MVAGIWNSICYTTAGSSSGLMGGVWSPSWSLRRRSLRGAIMWRQNRAPKRRSWSIACSSQGTGHSLCRAIVGHFWAEFGSLGLRSSDLILILDNSTQGLLHYGQIHDQCLSTHFVPPGRPGMHQRGSGCKVVPIGGPDTEVSMKDIRIAFALVLHIARRLRQGFR